MVVMYTNIRTGVTYYPSGTLAEYIAGRGLSQADILRDRAKGIYLVSFPDYPASGFGAKPRIKPNLPEGADLSSHTSWYFVRDKADHSGLLNSHHDSIRSELWLLKNQSTLFDVEYDVLRREWHQLTREKVGKTDLQAVPIQHNIDANRADVVKLTKRYEELAKRLFPACLAQAIIVGYDLRTGDQLSLQEVIASADVLGKAILATTNPVTRKVAISKWLVQHLELDANDESYDANGARTTDDATRLLPKGWKIVDTFSEATSGRPSSATRDSGLKEVRAVELINKAVAATAPTPSGV